MRFLNVLLIVLLSCFLLSACGSAASNSDNHNNHAKHKPALDITLEVSGNQAKVSVNTDMSISPEHYGMARKAGEGHIHMYLDNNDKIAVTEPQHVFGNLEPGKHTLKVSLHNNDHTPYDVTKSYEFEILP